MPWKEPNVRLGYEKEDLYHHINAASAIPCIISCPAQTLCCLTGVGCCYLWSKMQLIRQGEWGFTNNNGSYEILFPGRHYLSSPFNSYIKTVSQGDDYINAGPITILRVNKGEIGCGWDDGQPELLRPGRHVRNAASYKFIGKFPVTQNIITFGPIKIFVVKSGHVRVCYEKGSVMVYREGRYAVNSNTFEVGNVVNTQMQNVRFSQHPVLLDGGISMLVEGLLTYQVTDVQKLTREIGENFLLPSIEDITKAELSRVFAGVQLEKLASPSQNSPSRPADVKTNNLLGAQESVSVGEGGSDGCRSAICHQVIEYIAPICAKWGVQVINFQLESTKIADRKYALEYEECSLGLAKAQANRRSVQANNEILLQKAQAKANAQAIEAQGRANAIIIEAKGAAEARCIEAKARNDAAVAMNDEFAKQLQLNGLQVDFAKNLKAQVLTVVPESSVGKMAQVPYMTMQDAKVNLGSQ